MQPVLALRGATKRFPGVVALKGVDVEFFPGRVHALLGENGAGKSTLVRIVSGIHPPDKGETLLDGRPVALSSPRASERAGIAVVHQHRTLVDELSVAENLFLGQLGGDFRGFGLNRFVRLAEPILAELGLEVDPRTLVGSLGPAAQQMVEIGRALSRRPRVLVFDEPTTSLTPPERQVLFDLVRRLRTQGLAIVYISHDLEDTLALSDEVTVLRDGALAAHLVGDVSVAEVVRHMLGREMDAPSPHRRAPGRERVLVAQDLMSKALGGVSVAVHRGEIVCIAGLVGSGRTELLRTLFGLDGYESGRIELNGRTHRPRSPRDSIRRGVGLVTEDRKRQGLVLPLGVGANVLLGNEPAMARAGFVSARRSRSLVQTMIESLRIKTPSQSTVVGQLSGGNQQKVVLGRWMARRPSVLLIDEPTVGIDIGARSEFYRLLDSYAAEGGACLVVSSDLSEVLDLADRVVVMRGGRSVAEFEGDQMTRQNILESMTVGAA